VVTQDLIHKFLGKGLPSGAGELLRDVIDSTLYTPRCEHYPQAGGISYEKVSAVGRMSGRLWLIFTETAGGLHTTGFKVVFGVGVLLGLALPAAE